LINALDNIANLEEVLPKTLDTTSLSIGFDMKPKQAAALLANN
jgi:hypothetical protein